MQIAFVAMIIALNGFIISSINDIHMKKVQTSSAYKEMYQKIEMVESLSSTVKLAYDLGQQLSGCPVGSRELQNVAAVAPVKLCWVNLDADNCFNSSQTRGRDICISSSQSIVQNFNTPSIHRFAINQMIKTAHASYSSSGSNSGSIGGSNGGNNGGSGNVNDPFSAMQPVREYTEAATYIPPVVDAMGTVVMPTTEAGARIELPTDSAPTQVGSNFINCTRSHTECFSVTFCLNGGTGCSGRSRMTQTFAVRHY